MAIEFSHSLDERILLSPKICISEFPLKAANLATLSQRAEIGPLDYTANDLSLKVNGTIIARGRLEFEGEQPVFTITEISRED